MSVNGVTGASDVYSTYATQSKSTETKTENKTNGTENKTNESAGAVYEPSKETQASSVKKTYKPDTNMVAKLKADAEARTAQLKSLVEKMLTKQGETYGKANDIWSILSSGNFTVDPATKAQAQADIAEDGYWGVSQTSQRILDFATALTGGDPDKIEEMRSAFLKGYKQAEKTWGGNLPDISKQTYDAVMKGFDDMAAAAKKVESTEE
ncbi:MAG: hypothetical protein K2P07_00365 [Lachnospiraceae bacterium]|nr:hypothetical protein [Lachnospiraceae bacterium]MDE7006603.1 hypothetical protein [Lachnospiraceae bacterium]